MSSKRRPRARRQRSNPYRRPDARADQARAAGYVARSVYKLEEIDRRLGLIKRGSRVLDLGAAPGSWSQYCAEHIGPQGKLIAVDLKPISLEFPPCVELLEGDARDMGEQLTARGPFDIVLSDMAPNTTGDKPTDKYRSFDLFCQAAQLATELLVEGGSFVGKIFMSGHFPEARELLRRHFERVRVIRPEAVRTVSYEVFLAGLGLQRQTDGQAD